MNRMVLVDEADSYDGYCIQLCGVADRLEKRDSLSRPFVKRPGASNHKAPADSMDWEPSTGRVAAAANDAAGERKFRAKWVTEKKLARRRKEKLYFRYDGSGHGVRNCLYLPAKRSTAPAEADNKEKAIKIAAANDKKTARLQVEEVSNLEPASASDSENE